MALLDIFETRRNQFAVDLDTDGVAVRVFDSPSQHALTVGRGLRKVHLGELPLDALVVT
jgi:hypothetical protein